MEENLKELIKIFYEEKLQADLYKKSADNYNKEIKDGMTELGISEFESDGLVAKMSIQQRESFNDMKLLEVLRTYSDEIPGLIVMEPKVDMDRLEDAIYNGRIDATILTPAKEVKEVVTLKVSKKKEK